MTDRQFDDELRGALFKNKDKVQGDKRPDYKGYVQVNGVRYEQAAWLRTASKTGEKFMSISLEAPRQSTQGAAPPPQAAAPVQAAPVAPPPDEEIPFLREADRFEWDPFRGHPNR